MRTKPWPVAAAMALAVSLSGLVLPATSAAGAEAAAATDPSLFPYPVALGTDKTATGVASTSKVLGIQAPRDQDRSPVIQWTASGNADQQWDVKVVNQSMAFVNRGSGKAISVEGNSTANGARIIQWTYKDTNIYQQWRPDVDVDGDGYPNLRNVGTGKCLAIEGGGSTEIAARAVLWDCSTGADQEWWFYPAPAVAGAQALTRSAAQAVTGADADDPDTGEPDAETEPIDEDVEEGETPDWVDPEPAATDVGEAEPRSGVIGGSTGGDATPYEDGQEPLDPATAGRLFDLAVQESLPETRAPSSRTLGLKQYGQIKGYYCGPAAGYAMLRYRNVGKSKYNGKSLSQKELASSAHMNTDNVHGTPWLSKRFVKGLNRWRGNTYYYVQINKPTESEVRVGFRSMIGTFGEPVAGDTVEFAGGKHYNGHPRYKTIGHWIVGYGYESSGRKVKLADPATSVFPNAKAKFKMSSSDLAFFLKSNGIVL